MKQSQGNQTWHDLVDSKQGNNNSKFEKKTCLNSVHEKANNKLFVKSGNRSIISLEYIWSHKIVVYSWPALCI